MVLNMSINEFYLQQFYDTIALSLMKIECKSVSESNIEGIVLFEADDFDDIKLQFEWIAIKDSDFVDQSNFHSIKKIKGWVIGFKKISENDTISSIVLVDDTLDTTIPKENQISLIKSFIHENFLWEREVFNLILDKV